MDQEPVQAGINPLPNKMDLLFYNSYLRARNSHILRAAFDALKLLLLSASPFSTLVLSTPHRLIISWLQFAIVFSLFNTAASMAVVGLLYADNRRNNQRILQLALTYEHAVPAEPIEGEAALGSLRQCVSARVYNQQSQTEIDNQTLTSVLKTRIQSPYSNCIGKHLISLSPFLSTAGSLAKLGSFCSITFGVGALSTIGPFPTLPAIYLLMQALTIWPIILVLIVFGLSPLSIIPLCLYCCCRKADPGAETGLPDSVTATAQMMQGTCNICLQNLELGEWVMVLPCSNKHIFHEGCMGKWVKFALTCPLCRHRLR